MNRYLEELKNSEVIIKQKQNLQARLQSHDITKHLTSKSHHKIIDEMLMYRLRNVGTYVRFVEMIGCCLGETTTKIDDKFLKHQFNIQLVQLELQKLKKQKFVTKKLQQVNTPSTEMESISSKPQKMQKVLEDVRARQTTRDLVKIEEYFQQKKVKRYQSIEGFVQVDQSRLKQPICTSMIEKSLKFFADCCKKFTNDFVEQQ